MDNFDPTKKIIQKVSNPEQVLGSFETSEQIENIKKIFKINPELEQVVYDNLGLEYDKDIVIELGRSKISEAHGKVQNINVYYKGSLIIDSDNAAAEKLNEKLYLVTKQDGFSYPGDIALPNELRGQGLGVRILQKAANLLDTKIIPTYIATGGHTSPQALSMWEKAGNEIIPNNDAEKTYAKYLETIFPESKVKEILWHGTLMNFESFEHNSHFGTYKSAQERLDIISGGVESLKKRIGKTIPVTLNITNLESSEIDYSKAWDMYINTLPKECDGFSYVNVYEDKGSVSYVVLNPEQIHILGSQSDIEGFKKYIESNK